MEMGLDAEQMVVKCWVEGRAKKKRGKEKGKKERNERRKGQCTSKWEWRAIFLGEGAKKFSLFRFSRSATEVAYVHSSSVTVLGAMWSD